MNKIYLSLLSFALLSCAGENNNFSVIKEKMSQIIPAELEIDSIQRSEVENFYEIELSDKSFFYVEENAQYLFLGDIYKLGENELINISQQKKFSSSQEMLKKINPESLISFTPELIKYKIYVFTDVDCGFCRKFHNQIDSYLNEGIQINYLAFPRSGIESKTYKKMTTAWCSDDRQKVLTGLKNDEVFDQIDCEDNPIKEHYQLAKSIDIQGTPTIISSTGLTIPGFIEAKEIVEYLK
ncbi:MAG: DsbC family protein [Gammaproteobacteria bacterium]